MRKLEADGSHAMTDPEPLQQLDLKLAKRKNGFP
jgi:hypothetical protein